MNGGKILRWAEFWHTLRLCLFCGHGFVCLWKVQKNAKFGVLVLFLFLLFSELCRKMAVFGGCGYGLGTVDVFKKELWQKERKLQRTYCMNKKTRAVTKDEYKRIISTIREGFTFNGKIYKPNVRIATILTLEYNLGLRISDILQLQMDSFLRDGNRWRLDIYEQKTNKYRNFTVVSELYQYIRDYAYENEIGREARLFPITERAVSKHLKVTADYLGLERIGTHSFRKGFATNIYEDNNYNIELVRLLLQHSSVTISQRYIGIGTKELETALQNNVDLC